MHRMHAPEGEVILPSSHLTHHRPRGPSLCVTQPGPQTTTHSRYNPPLTPPSATYPSARRIELETITLARVALAAPVHQPMLASGGTIPTRGDYAYEVSWDGFRAIVSRPRDRSASAADAAGA